MESSGIREVLCMAVFSLGGLIGCTVQTMTWQRPPDKNPPAKGGDVCIILRREAVEYTVRVEAGVDRSLLRIGRTLEDIVEFETERYFTPRMIVVVGWSGSGLSDSQLCPQSLSRLIVRVMEVKCETHSDSLIGANSVMARAHTEVEFRDVAGDTLKADYPSAKVFAGWPWFTSASRPAADEAVPIALQDSLRRNLDFVMSCRSGRCKTEAEMASPERKWAKDFK